MSTGWPEPERAFLLATSGPPAAKTIVRIGAVVDAVSEKKTRTELLNLLGVADEIDKKVTLLEIIQRFQTKRKKAEVDIDRTRIHEICNAAVDGHVDALTWRAVLDGFQQQTRSLRNESALAEDKVQEIDNNIAYCERMLETCMSSSTTPPEQERLIIQVIEIRSDKWSPAHNNHAFRLQLEKSDSQYVISAPRKQFGGRVFCNEVFAFKMERPEGVILVTLEDVIPGSPGGPTDPPHTIATGELPLDSLSDQGSREIECDLNGSGGFTAVVLMKCQWIESKLKFFEQHLLRYRQARTDMLRHQNAVDTELRALNSAFFMDDDSTAAPNLGLMAIKVLAQSVTKPDEFVDMTVKHIMFSVNATNFDKVSQVTLVTYAALACFASFTRVFYIDSLIALVAFWNNLEPSRRWSAKQYLFALLALVTAQAFDCWWIYYDFRMFQSPDQIMAHLTKILTLIMFFWRVVVFFVVMKLRADYKREHREI